MPNNTGNPNVKLFNALGWQGTPTNMMVTNVPERYIQIEYDTYGVESDRYLTIIGTGSYDYACNSEPIMLCKDDCIKLSYDFRAYQNHNYYGNLYSYLFIQQDINTPTFLSLSSNDDGNWVSGLFGISQQLEPNKWTEWKTIEITSKPVPYDCYAFLCFTSLVSNPKEVSYKNIKIEVSKKVVAGSTANSGNVHRTTIPYQIKNIEDESIYLDDSTKWNISGTLFLPQFVGGQIRKKTLGWTLYPYSPIQLNLGETILRQEHIWRHKQRLKLEGRMFPVIHQSTFNDLKVILSPLNKLFFLVFDPQSGIEMIFGKLEINYKENICDFTSYELGFGNIYQEPNDIVYTFKFLQK